MQDERRTTLVELLDHWRDFFEEPREFSMVGGEEQGNVEWSAFSAMGRYPSVRELRRCVELCAKMGPRHYKHLLAYTVRVEWRLTEKPVGRRDVRGRWVTEPRRVRERIVPRWVEMRLVERALDFILGSWNREVPLELPPPLTLKLRPLADADGWTEAA